MAPASTREAQLLKIAIETGAGEADYREFLKRAMLIGNRSGSVKGRPNLAAFSRKAGFTSRSFILEVLDGRRRLTAKSYPKVVKALALPPKLKTYFQLLVAREEADLNIESLTAEQIELRLQALRGKFLLQAEGLEGEDKAAQAIFRSRDMLDCYAALGNRERGVELGEIVNKTGLPLETCQKVLAHFVAQTVVVEKNGRFYSRNPHYIFKGLGANVGVKDCYLQSLAELRRKANGGFDQPDRAFFQSIFSVDRRKLPALKQKLWDVLNEFVESNENDEGDQIGKLVVGFYS
jgi:uncharacterized protein (TIGR02147 family)